MSPQPVAPLTPAQETVASGIVWEDPPPQATPARKAHPWASWARMLKRHPMRWAKLAQFERPTTAKNLTCSKDRKAHLPRENFEVRAGLIGAEGEAVTGSGLWARYIGGDES